MRRRKIENSCKTPCTQSVAVEFQFDVCFFVLKNLILHIYFNMENKHNLSLDNRKKLSVTGVVGVDSMSDKEVDILLADSRLTVKGEGLTVNKLNVDDGNLTVLGENFVSLVYADKNKAKNSLTKLFK